MNQPKASPPVETGWADFTTPSFQSNTDNNHNNKVEENKADNWFDFVDGFGKCTKSSFQIINTL